MFSHEFVPMNYHRWFLLNKVWVETQYRSEYGEPFDKDTRCSHCDGQGYAECDLGHSHDCEECDGEGKTTKSPGEVLEEYGWKLYREQVISDREKVNKFLKEQEQEHAS